MAVGGGEAKEGAKTRKTWHARPDASNGVGTDALTTAETCHFPWIFE